MFCYRSFHSTNKDDLFLSSWTKLAVKRSIRRVYWYQYLNFFFMHYENVLLHFSVTFQCFFLVKTFVSNFALISIYSCIFDVFFKVCFCKVCYITYGTKWFFHKICLFQQGHSVLNVVMISILQTTVTKYCSKFTLFVLISNFQNCKVYIPSNSYFFLWTWIICISCLVTQCPRVDLNKKSLPRPKTTTACKLIPHRSKISKN